jgi:hypothetical protein
VIIGPRVPHLVRRVDPWGVPGRVVRVAIAKATAAMPEALAVD